MCQITAAMSNFTLVFKASKLFSKCISPKNHTTYHLVLISGMKDITEAKKKLRFGSNKEHLCCLQRKRQFIILDRNEVKFSQGECNHK